MFNRVYYTLRALLKHPPGFWRGIIACPHAEPLHYHHDGCPACWEAECLPDPDRIDGCICWELAQEREDWDFGCPACWEAEGEKLFK